METEVMLGIKVSDCRKRWKILRDAFGRNRKQKKMPSGSAGGTIKEWRYEKVMSFLLPHMQARPSRNTLQPEEEVPLDMTVTEEDLDPELSELSSPPSTFMTVQSFATPTPSAGQRSATPTPPLTTTRSAMPTPPISAQRSATPTPHPRVQALKDESQQPRQKWRRTVVPNPTEQQLLDIITQPTTSSPPYIPRQEDEMYYFAMSLVPKLNRLHPRLQTRAQIYILNYLSDLQFEEENLRQQHSTTPTGLTSPSCR
ncbi:undifferentiated embryonic cell transcription factor 1 isoform X2 [Ictalurus punctatus]|uniref:Undifferentiated embryonic cell transcription factor 1 isoform X2 n=1 Tax=Ictalurus punctatus TaxID=7998 RepID=A0A9F7R606_ICTPU|nr:undifferentiated embryonic cell transcription factor 1 isoform X2 [Ictalurus punctatus]